MAPILAQPAWVGYERPAQMDATSAFAALDAAGQQFAAGRLSEAEPPFRHALWVRGADVTPALPDRRSMVGRVLRCLDASP
jgi:hypothetical protein